MPQAESESPDESFFNDLSQQGPDSNNTNGQETQPDGSAKPKRIACVLCRKRKLRCDGARPTCATCKRLSHDCAYDEVRKKSGPKRGYVKLLEQRLQQVETLLKTQDADSSKDATRQDSTSAYVASTLQQALPNSGDYLNTSARIQGAAQDSRTPGTEPFHNAGVCDNNGEQDFPWEMIGLGLEEPLPPQDVMDDLPRFLAALNLAPHMRPPVCLRYIMWTLAASVTEKYEALQEHFYQRARKYAQMDEMKGHGESTITLAHCQSWTLTCTYEFKHMYFPRAWLSAGRAVRLGQMMQLHRLDGAGLDVKQCLPPPKDWTEREEHQVMNPNGAANLQSLGCIVLTAAMFGRNLLHLHRPGPDDNDEDINGGFWNRHRHIEQILLQTSLGLPDHLRLPSGLTDPNVVFANMCIHTSAICLHQAAIFKADKYRLPASVSNESKIRCVTAAAEIASIMRMISHMDLGAMNPFISFCVYVAARVFVQYLKTRPKDQQMNSSLQFLLQAMQALRRKNPLTESFLVQLDLDLESAGIIGLQQKPYLTPTSRATDIPVNSDAVQCSPLIEIRESQNPSAAINTFGNGDGIASAAGSAHQFPSNAPGPPFHVSSINSVDLNAQTPGFLPSQSRSASNREFPPSGFAFPESNDMDMSGDRSVDQPSPATLSSQSRGGSTSHSSYSPGQQNEHHLPYRASPKMPLGQMQNSSGGMGPATVFPGFSSSGEMYANTFSSSGNMNDDGFQQEFLVGNGWEFTAMNAGTGMTPMADVSTWDSMLESVTMGWDTLGPPHQHQSPGSR
ncbi:hypothetical protein N0V83_006973 [Neocucurbitaria cava]|uniref:Zn(2)-C6 fungal-type domain-containing protein n=1 Tax=Neocucurbitaria cava TaxID=798079 RepID=A0A9W8Y4N3_9PLEO|nr:hypothetical protein N0V83_006973 [Neocucurbitaria cava]